MPRVNPVICNFTAGEFSPTLFGRTDLSKYYSACEKLENMITLPHGPAFRRPGTYFVREVIGRDFVTNGTFASDTGWTKGPGWTIAGGKAVGSAGAIGAIYQVTGNLTEGRAYEFIFTLSDRTAGSVSPWVGGVKGTSRTSSAKYTERITCDSTDVVSIQKTADFDGKIDDIIVRQIAPKTRLESFQFSTVQAYILEFTDQNLRIYKDNGIILDGDDPYEVTTPYVEADLFELQMTQSADIMTIVHNGYSPRELARTGHTSWTLDKIDFKDGPFEEELDMEDIASMVIEDATKANPCVITVTSADAADDDYIKITDIKGMTELNGNCYQLAGKSGVTYTLKDMNGDAIDSAAYTEYVSGGLARCTIKPSATTGSVTLLSWGDVFVATDTGRLIRIRSRKITAWDTATDYVNGDHALSNENYKCILDHKGKKPPYAMYWEESGKDGWYWLKITAFTSTKQVTATIEGDDLPNTDPIVNYQLGVWESEKGYPSCVDYFEERLIFAGSNDYPQTIWASKSGDYDNMEAGTDDDSAFIYTIAAKGVNPIHWIVPQNVLLIGTKGAEWKMGSSGTDEPINTSNVFVKRQSTWGSKNVQALLVNDIVLFVQRAGTKIRELTEDPMSISGKYIAPDLTILAEHITKGGIIDIAYQQEPTAIVWCIRNDGVLLGLTYERAQEVVGWHRHLTNDGTDAFESVAVNTTTGEDEVWVCVQREIEGETRRYIEYFKPWDWGSDRTDVFFIDSGLSSNHGNTVSITGATKADPVVITATTDFDDDDKVRILSVKGMVEINENIYIVASKTDTTFELKDLDGNNIDGSAFTEYISGGTVQQVAKTYSGLSHLAGRTTSVLGDGSVMPSVEVSTSGEVTLSDYVNKVHIGLGYTSKIQPMNIEAGAVAGTAQGKVKKIHKCTVRLKDTMACKMGTCDDDLEEILFRGDEDVADEPVPLFTGDKNISAFPGNFDTNGTVLITCDVPLPMTIVSIMPEFSLKDLL